MTALFAAHIHKPEMREVNGLLYLNDGDWVESLSALVEHHDGRLELLDWQNARSTIKKKGTRFHAGTCTGNSGRRYVNLKIAIVTDAWYPQINGVVRTLTKTVEGLRACGHDVIMITPETFRTVPCPTYPEIRLSIFPSKRVSAQLRAFGPDCIHISTEGPLGLAARAFAKRNQLAFTTAYHTRFPEYVRSRIRIPLSWTYAFLRWFHGSGNVVMAPTNAVLSDLEKWRIGNPVIWPRGVDLDIFKPATSAKRTVNKKKSDLHQCWTSGGRKEYRGFP